MQESDAIQKKLFIPEEWQDTWEENTNRQARGKDKI